MKSKKTKSKSENKYDTFSITMELENPLLYDNEDKKIDDNKKNDEIDIKKRFAMYFIIILLFVVSFFTWMSNGYTLQESERSYLESNSTVEVTTEGEYTYFIPKNIKSTKGFILYPGERIDSSAYAKLCNNIASYGYKVISVEMPFNYSKFGKNKANEVIKQNSDITKWVIGGDSIGGSVACEYAIDKKNVDGIVLISSYSKENISKMEIDVLSIWGSKDSVISYTKLIDSRKNLPRDAQYIEIEGANHSQFANYGTYSRDEEALISSDDQMSKTVEYIVNFLEEI